MNPADSFPPPVGSTHAERTAPRPGVAFTGGGFTVTDWARVGAAVAVAQAQAAWGRLRSRLGV